MSSISYHSEEAHKKAYVKLWNEGHQEAIIVVLDSIGSLDMIEVRVEAKRYISIHPFLIRKAWANGAWNDVPDAARAPVAMRVFREEPGYGILLGVINNWIEKSNDGAAS